MTWIHHGVYYNLSVFSVARMFSVFRLVACTCAKLFMSLGIIQVLNFREREREKI